MCQNTTRRFKRKLNLRENSKVKKKFKIKKNYMQRVNIRRYRPAIVVSCVVDVFKLYGEDKEIEFYNSTPSQQKILNWVSNLEILSKEEDKIKVKYENIYPHIVNKETLIDYIDRSKEGIIVFNLYGTYKHVQSDIEFLVHDNVLMLVQGEHGNILFKKPVRTQSWEKGDGCTAIPEMKSIYFHLY